jgi:hypothetical protein
VADTGDLMTDAEVARLATAEKVAEAMRRSLSHLPANARGVVKAMLEPQSVAIVAGTLTAWAGSHFFGVGEVVDVALLTVGLIGLGFSVFEGAAAVYDFTIIATRARSESELDLAGQHFARAVALLGVSTLQALLLHGQGRLAIARGRPRVFPPPNVGAVPPAGNQLRLSRPPQLPGGKLGGTSPFGEIRIARNQPMSEQRITLYHELVHRYFSPRTGPLRQLRAELAWSAYSRSAFLKYLEEALAEGYGQLRVNGLTSALRAYRFPIQGGYVTIADLAYEGQAVGSIVLGGSTFRVSVSLGTVPEN